MSKVFRSRTREWRSRAMFPALVLGLLVAACDQDPPPEDSGVDASAACSGDEACTDGLYCNGVERCAAERCTAGTAPCAAARCHEAAGTCDADCDGDGDGHHALVCGGDDCDDDDSARAPGNSETCDTRDVDEDCDATTFGDRDADGDGFASAACCNVSTDGTRLCGEDCDDARRGVSPDVTDGCDSIDNDCDGAIDENQLTACFPDADGDGYAVVAATSVESCACPARTTIRPPSDAADCDDALPDVSPGSPEICSNGRDDDCDGTVDEAGNDWYRDCDGDGFGAGAPVRACASPGTPVGCPGGGHELRADDCDDGRVLVYPEAPEVCDGVANDCATSTVDGPIATAWCNDRAPSIVAACTDGVCVFERCVTEFLDCTSAPGCETDSRTDTANCGECGNACWGGAACVMGACGEPRELSAGGFYTCARRGSGAVDCWGANEYGQLGDGTTVVSRTVPTPVVGLTDAVELSAVDLYTCARRTSGAVGCWGSNSVGQLGNGTTNTSLTPTAVSGLTDAVELAGASGHTCARRASSVVVCWGNNIEGQLGDGTTTGRLTPTPVSGLSDALEVAAGDSHTCARRPSGAVACWGANYYGQVGDSTTTARLTPTAVSGLTDAVELSADDYHTCARRASGAVVCWGRNASGQLGDGTLINRTSPTPVSGLIDAVELSAGAYHTCARRASGAVVCWGRNVSGQLGDGTNIDRLTPTTVSGLTDAVEVSAGREHTCARRASGAVVCWGRNTYGALGDSTTTDRLTPTAVQPPP